MALLFPAQVLVTPTTATWVIFNAVVIALLLIDLFGFNKEAHKIELKEAAWESAFFILASLGINVWVWWMAGPGIGESWSAGHDAGLTWLTAYVIEKSLSVDNLFVIAVLLRYFQVPAKYQHRVLFWGIFGAIVMRAVMILLGVALIERFDWVLYVFGVFLIITGLRMLKEQDEPDDPGQNRLLKLLRRVIPVTRHYHGEHFLVRIRGHLVATPLLLVLVMIELSDVLFAVDSIPAVLGITTDRFVAYSSNIMAVVGLRALYFLLVGVIERLRFLHIGLSIVLVFIGVKMLLEDVVHVPTWVSLLVILGVLLAAAGFSWNATRRERRAAAREARDPLVAPGPPPAPDHDEIVNDPTEPPPDEPIADAGSER